MERLDRLNWFVWLLLVGLYSLAVTFVIFLPGSGVFSGCGGEWSLSNRLLISMVFVLVPVEILVSWSQRQEPSKLAMAGLSAIAVGAGCFLAYVLLVLVAIDNCGI